MELRFEPRDPEPLVLVEEFADAKVYLRVYFWINIKEHSSQKVRSSIMRLTKKALQDADLSQNPAPSEPSSQAPVNENGEPKNSGGAPEESSRIRVQAEGQFTSEKGSLEKQARQSRRLEAGPDLLSGNQNRDNNEPAVEPDSHNSEPNSARMESSAGHGS